ncbi:MAG: hypothetical protein KDA85_12180, partial [Planctomycetaceae bacterium]|nr:hypothetical protein [Planctomycetaceae bacterium]
MNMLQPKSLVHAAVRILLMAVISNCLLADEDPVIFPALTDDVCANADRLDEVLAHLARQRERLEKELAAEVARRPEQEKLRNELRERLWVDYQQVRDALRGVSRGEKVDLADYDPLMIEIAALAEWQKRQLERSRDVCQQIADVTFGNIIESHWSTVIAENKIQRAQTQFREMVDQNRRDARLFQDGRIARIRAISESAMNQAEHLMSKASELDRSIATWSESQKRARGDAAYQKSTQSYLDHQNATRAEVTTELSSLRSRLEKCEQIVEAMRKHRIGGGAVNPNSGLYSDLQTITRQLQSAYLDEYDPFMDPPPGSAEWKKRRDDPRYAFEQDLLRQQEHARAMAAEAMFGMDPEILLSSDFATIERETMAGVSKVEHYRKLAENYDRMASDVEVGVKNNLLSLTGIELDKEYYRIQMEIAAQKKVRDRLQIYRDLSHKACEQRGKTPPKPIYWDRIMVHAINGAKLTSAHFEWRTGGRQIVTAVSGQWKEKIDQFDAPHNYGAFEVPGSGKLRAELKVSPPAPNKWSLYNSDTELQVLFQPKLGDGYGPAVHVLSVGGRVGEKPRDFDEKEGTWSGKGRLLVSCGPACGSGPLTGGQFDQTYGGIVEILETYATCDLTAPQMVDDGDRLVTDPAGEMWLATPLSRIWVGPNSDLTLKLANDQVPRHRWDVQAGKLRVTGSHSETPAVVERGFYEPGFDFRLSLKGKLPQADSPGPRFVVQPTGTDFELEHRGETAVVRVFSGSVAVLPDDGTDQQRDVQNGDPTPLRVTAGEECLLPEGLTRTFDASTDSGLTFAGVPALEVPVFQRVDLPDGEWTAEFDGMQWKDGWLWQDPGQDAQVEKSSNAIARISVPHGNDFWQRTTTAPRLLHSVTGDFLLETELDVRCEGKHLAIVEFLMYSPASSQGVLAAQTAAGPGADYRILSGGWTQLNNESRLPLFGRSHYESASVPDDGHIHLRLSREGNVWQTLWSTDGEHWNLSGRQIIETHPMVWVGLCFKRVAHDGLTDEPLVCDLQNLSLKSGPVDWESPWNVLALQGHAEPSDRGVVLTLDDSESGETMVYHRRPLEGDLDVVLRYDVEQWEHHPGESRTLMVGLDSFDQSNQTYIGFSRNESYPGDLIQADVRVDGAWKHHQQVRVSSIPRRGWLQLKRAGKEIVLSCWLDGRWERIAKVEHGFAQPVHVYAQIANTVHASVAASVRARVSVERMECGLQAMVAEPFTPDRAEVLELSTVESTLQLPPDVVEHQWNSSFPLGRLFTDGAGNAYVFSAARETARLVRIQPSGTSRAFLGGSLVAGLNRKAGAFGPDGVLISVDFWPDGGTSLGGIYATDSAAESSPSLWKQGLDYGDITDLLWIEDTGWTFIDSTRGNVFRITPLGDIEPLIADGERLRTPMELAWDPQTHQLFVLDQTSVPPSAEGGSTIHRIRDGRCEQVLQIGSGRWLKSIAVSPGGTFSAGLYGLDSDGQLLLLSGAESQVRISGLREFEQIRFTPQGQLWMVGGGPDSKVVLLENPIVASMNSDQSPGVRPPEPLVTVTPSGPMNASSQSPETVRLGLVAADVDSQAAIDLSVESTAGVVVVAVRAASPADHAGLKPGDV